MEYFIGLSRRDTHPRTRTGVPTPLSDTEIGSVTTKGLGVR